MKKCTDCGKEHDRKRQQCKSCYNAYMREYMGKRHERLMQEFRDHLGGCCAECGSDDQLQIDHIDSSTKSFTIGKSTSIKREAIYEELKKCQLLCQTCHNLKTISDNGWQVAKGNHGTISSYMYCRCDICRKAHSDYCKQWSRRNERKNRPRKRNRNLPTGVVLVKNHRYLAQALIAGRRLYFGRHDTVVDARAAWLRYMNKNHPDRVLHSLRVESLKTGR